MDIRVPTKRTKMVVTRHISLPKRLKIYQNPSAFGALPRSPLWKLTASSGLLVGLAMATSWWRGKGRMRKMRGGKERKGRR